MKGLVLIHRRFQHRRLVQARQGRQMPTYYLRLSLVLQLLQCQLEVQHPVSSQPTHLYHLQNRVQRLVLIH
jgi:hypothetical protein